MINDDIYYDFHEFLDLMKKTTENLNRMKLMQERMRWQFDYPAEYESFLAAMNDTTEGWVSSHC